MKIGPACYTLAPVRAIAVQGPLFPWQRKYRVAKQELVNAPWLEQRANSSAEVGWRLFTMEPLMESTWMQLDIRPLGTALFGESQSQAVDLPTEVSTLDTIAGAGIPLDFWTPAKARVLYPLAGGTIREIRFDINTGVTIAIPPTNKVDVDLLVWDDDIADVQAPDGIGNILRGVRFATLVSCKATAVQYANPVSKPRWTQVAFIDGSSSQLGSAQIPLVQNAGTVQIIAGTVDPGANLALGDVRAFMRSEFEETVQGVFPTGLSLATPQFPIDFDTPNNSKIVPVPGSQANVVRLGAEQAGTPLFNAAVIQEINC